MAFGHFVKRVTENKAGRPAGSSLSMIRRTSLETFFRDQQFRIQRRLDAADDRIARARRAAKEVDEFDGSEIVVTKRGHAHGHDAGPDWREGNL